MFHVFNIFDVNVEKDGITSKGPVIFNAGYWGGVKQGGVPKYFATFSWVMKTFCHVLMGYENILSKFHGVQNFFWYFRISLRPSTRH